MRSRTFLAGSVVGFLLAGSVGASLVAARDAIVPETTGTMVLTESSTLDADHAGNIRIVADGVTLDCAGHTVHGPGIVAPGAEGFSGGIDFANLRDITIRNCVVTGFQYNGIFGYGSVNVRIEANTVSRNAAHGIALAVARGAAIVDNVARANGTENPACGFIITDSSGVTIMGNSASDNPWAGFNFGGTIESRMTGNRATRNGTGLVVDDGPSGAPSRDNIVEGNALNANEYGVSVLRGSTANTFTGNTANANSSRGFFIFLASGNTYRDNVANSNVRGFDMAGASDSFVSRNTANGNSQYGFAVYAGAHDNTLSYNTGLGNAEFDAVGNWNAPDNVWIGNNFRTTDGFPEV